MSPLGGGGGGGGGNPFEVDGPPRLCTKGTKLLVKCRGRSRLFVKGGGG